MGDDANLYELVRIGTKSEKESVEKELQELRETLAQVEQLKQRRQDIEDELSKVWTSSGLDEGDPAEDLEAPPYEDSGNGMDT